MNGLKSQNGSSWAWRSNRVWVFGWTAACLMNDSSHSVTLWVLCNSFCAGLALQKNSYHVDIGVCRFWVSLSPSALFNTQKGLIISNTAIRFLGVEQGTRHTSMIESIGRIPGFHSPRDISRRSVPSFSSFGSGVAACRLPVTIARL